MTTESPLWFKSSYSNNGGACIEIAANLVAAHGTVPIRDSKRPTGPVLAVATRAFADFVGGVKAGDFGAV
ncbi:DUF397 domain-containing protein [Streptomyces flavofungini]|uniref:DUF397 domain-containing protein n=1 Tax=Streptomyces flavofungini TaxID=68200 RepID=UPI0025AF7159|nr:DUF397 domain-containing protein [Streptomyces flavofungini]WJV46121.1 DUF397 domain-containing protein [Streptomyces flavofungini]